jgi:hypothetical protein
MIQFNSKLRVQLLILLVYKIQKLLQTKKQLPDAEPDKGHYVLVVDEAHDVDLHDKLLHQPL